jgi:nicotinamidase-related amidase
MILRFFLSLFFLPFFTSVSTSAPLPENREALLIIDMSNDFVADRGSLSAGKPAQEIVPYIIRKADEFLKSGKPVIICMDSHKKGEKEIEGWPEHNIEGTWGQELYGGLSEWYRKNRANPDVYYVFKKQYDAFYGTDLEKILESRKITMVHLTGVCTDICVFLTGSGANDRGFKTVVHRAGTATFTGNHEVFLKHMELIFKSEVH